MLKQIVSKIWSKTPGPVRLRMIRASQKKFTASVAAIVVNNDQKILLLDHVLRPFSSWGLPGGFVGVGEQPEEAINREIFEETGLELIDVKLLRVQTLGRHIEILFTAKSIGKAFVRSHEINDLGWFSIDELPGKMSEAQKALVKIEIAELSQ